MSPQGYLRNRNARRRDAASATLQKSSAAAFSSNTFQKRQMFLSWWSKLAAKSVIGIGCEMRLPRPDGGWTVADVCSEFRCDYHVTEVVTWPSSAFCLPLASLHDSTAL